MDEKKFDKLIEKIMTVSEVGAPGDRYAEDDPDIKKIDVRSGAETGGDKKQSYEDWVRDQPKPNVIGIHKTKRR